MATLTPVLLCGGVGSRLWPVSRQGRPKQYLNLIGETSMLQQTLTRIESLAQTSPIIVCNEEHRFLVAEQVRQLGSTSPTIILEPEGKNTAPAIALAAIAASASNPEVDLLVLPADHYVGKPAALIDAIEKAASASSQGRLVTFGLVPSRPETGYGYIQRGEALATDVSVLEQFVEKPDQPTAEAYIASGDYVWNSGMFMFTAGQFLASLAQFQPEMARVCELAMEQAKRDMDFIRPDAEVFATCPSDSIDYAVMEHTPQGAVVSLDCDWSDIGAWSALWEAGDQDSAGNVTQGDVVLNKTQNSYVRSQSRLVTTTGVSDLVVVETADAVMVADLHSVQDVKDIVQSLKRADRSEADVHQRVFRPWGSYELLTSGDGFQVKRLIVNPGQQLSLQLHHHRAEHWVVVRGTAKVVNGDSELILSADQSTYIPVGVKHRLSNPGPEVLELIEVQSGSYLGEDDIIRFDDVYGR
ncbi:MAG: mannose-1-phosphate guanylyltransferase/mannose-6-phosphate isomerase [Pseudomonadota bacterium]|nr:mannose-1-phosphate guanylyltransferase/mannose-6-phosphate isomerase [Pseudomonadota bacterium]